jgi:nucleotide-binding universal stress UspA family protein
MDTKTFVIPLDGSRFAERAIPIARSMADRFGGGLLFVSTVESGPFRPSEYLDEVAARYSHPVIDKVVVDDRYPADAIVTLLAESDDRIVCMTSHGRGGLRWGLIGSVAEEVVRRADRPTLLVGRNCRDAPLPGEGHMLVCVDGSDASARLVPAVRDWAERLKLDVHAAIVVHPLDVESAERPSSLVDPIVGQFGGPDVVTAHVLTSMYPAGALADFAQDLPAAVIAMNSNGRTGLARVTLGSTTMSVLHQAPCPVLVTCTPPAKG